MKKEAEKKTITAEAISTPPAPVMEEEEEEEKAEPAADGESTSTFCRFWYGCCHTPLVVYVFSVLIFGILSFR